MSQLSQTKETYTDIPLTRSGFLKLALASIGLAATGYGLKRLEDRAALRGAALAPGGGDGDSFANLLTPIGASGTFLRSDGSIASWSDEPIVKTPSTSQTIQHTSVGGIPLTLREKRSDTLATSTMEFLLINQTATNRIGIPDLEGISSVLAFFEIQDLTRILSYQPLGYNPLSKYFFLGDFESGDPAFSKKTVFRATSSLLGGSIFGFDVESEQGVGAASFLLSAGAQITATPTGAFGAVPSSLAMGNHRHGVLLATLAQLADIAATEDLGIATSFVRGDHRHAHGSGYLPDAHHTELHTLTSHSTRTHSELTSIGANDHHAQSHGAADHSGDVIPDANQDAGAFFEDRSQIATPANPAAGIRRLFVDSADGKLKVRTSAGASVSLEEGGGTGETNTISFMVYFSKTKTNIGTAYVDIYNALEPDELFNVIDFSNFADFRIIFIWDYIGVGTQQVRWVDRANNANVLWESLTFTADQDGTDSGWVALPAWATGEKQIEWQGKSTTGTDDPIAKGFILLLR